MEKLTHRFVRTFVACTFSIGLSFCSASLMGQDRSIPGSADPDSPRPRETPRKKNWDSPEIVHPAPLGAGSRSLNNLDPTIVPYEGDGPKPLSDDSREIGNPPDGTGPTIYNPEDSLGKDVRSQLPGTPGARPIGTIYQMPDGQLKFVIPSYRMLGAGTRAEDRSFKGGKRGPDTADGTELVDPPVMTSGSYNQPLGRGSRDVESKNSEATDATENGKFSAEPLDAEPIAELGHVFEMSDGRTYILEPKVDADAPDALSSGSRDPASQMSLRKVGKHVPFLHSAIGDRIVLVAAEWRGAFNRTNAGTAFNIASRSMAKNRESAASAQSVKNSGGPLGNQSRRLAPDRHMVIGWSNLDRNEYHWFAVQSISRTSCRYLRHDGLTATASDWQSPLTWTNGQKIYIHFADDDNYGVAWRIQFAK